MCWAACTALGSLTFMLVEWAEKKRRRESRREGAE
jgi:hypothetical protein